MMSRNLLRQTGRVAGAISASGRIAAVSSKTSSNSLKSFNPPSKLIKELSIQCLKLYGSFGNPNRQLLVDFSAD